MDHQEGLIHAVILDGLGGCRFLDWEELHFWTPEQGVLWVHLQPDQPRARQWLQEGSGLDGVVVESLLEAHAHPHCSVEGDGGRLATFRGVNLNQGAEPEDMIHLNLWLEPQRVITTRIQRLKSVQDLVELLKEGRGAKTVGGVLVRLLDFLHDRMEPVLTRLEENLDRMEAQMVSGAGMERLPEALLDVRQEVIGLRRHLAPQRNALVELGREPPPWMGKVHRRQVREMDHRLQRFLEDLSSFRDRAVVIRDELNSQSGERMNRAMYMLSVVTGIFLPLSFLTGLLGINVGGMPGVENPLAFWLVCALLAFLGGVSLLLFRLLRWL